MTTSPVPHPVQPSFDDLGRHLATTAFVVVDLETTGAGPDATITEVGAVRVQSGEVVGEFQTLVNPCTHIPPLIQVLTGTTFIPVALGVNTITLARKEESLES